VESTHEDLLDLLDGALDEHEAIVAHKERHRDTAGRSAVARILDGILELLTIQFPSLLGQHAMVRGKKAFRTLESVLQTGF
jgi:hypothetical protein